MLGDNPEFLYDEYSIGLADLSQKVSQLDHLYQQYIEDWAFMDSPSARGFFYVEDIMQKLRGKAGHELGGIALLEGPMPGSNYRGAEADDVLTLSCLQRALVALGESTEIRVMG